MPILARMAITSCMALCRTQRISSCQNRPVRLRDLAVPCITLKELFSKVTGMLPKCSRVSTHVSPHNLVLIRILRLLKLSDSEQGETLCLLIPKLGIKPVGAMKMLSRMFTFKILLSIALAALAVLAVFAFSQGTPRSAPPERAFTLKFKEAGLKDDTGNAFKSAVRALQG